MSEFKVNQEEQEGRKEKLLLFMFYSHEKIFDDYLTVAFDPEQKRMNT